MWGLPVQRILLVHDWQWLVHLKGFSPWWWSICWYKYLYLGPSEGAGSTKQNNSCVRSLLLPSQ
jgi:hypothetical protein